MTNTDPIQPFYVPLTEILKDRGYTGDDHDVSARAFFLHNMYEKAQIHIDEKTLKTGFAKTVPNSKRLLAGKCTSSALCWNLTMTKRGIFLTAFISAAALTAAISGKPYTASASQKAKTIPKPHPSLNRLKRSWKTPTNTLKPAPPSGLPMPWRRTSFSFIQTGNF